MINEEGRKAARKGLKRYLMVRDTKRRIEDTTAKIGGRLPNSYGLLSELLRLRLYG